MRQALVIGSLIFFAAFAVDGIAAAQESFPSTYVPSGEAMYKQYCGACHGANAKGNGPAASKLKKQPPDLTTLSKRHGGKFPYDYVSSILRFGPAGSSAHGSSDMPTWGSIFLAVDKDSRWAVRDRIRNLSDYLASLQRK
jgi:mono/diheme cytochrome c family protein